VNSLSKQLKSKQLKQNLNKKMSDRLNWLRSLIEIDID
jgi:hypothetical protein